VLRKLVYRYLQAYLSQVSQSVACNRLHSTEERFARWLLISHDRVDGDVFHITQEFLANMLGVHRPSVTVVSKTFQQAGLITYNRGTVTVLDRKGLEAACCECYAVVRQKFQSAIGVAVS
jgi:CRP-like cAMP-binding protein